MASETFYSKMKLAFKKIKFEANNRWLLKLSVAKFMMAIESFGGQRKLASEK